MNVSLKPNIHGRAYLAGTGASGALIVGAVIAFLSMAGLIAFTNLPLPGFGAEGSVAIEDDAVSNSPSSLGPGGVAQSPDTVLAAARARGAGPAAGERGGRDGAPGLGPSSDSDGGAGAALARGGPGDASSSTPAPAQPAAPPSEGDSPGPISGPVGDLDETGGDLGLPPLSPATDPITRPAEQAVTETLNNVGGAVGNPNLGDQVGGAVQDLSNGVLGDQGVVGGVIGGLNGAGSDTPLTSTVGALDETAAGLGLPALSPATAPLTQALDDAVTGTLNNVGGVVGNPNLGNQVGGVVENVSNGLLGDDGVVGGVLDAGGAIVAPVAGQLQETLAPITEPLAGVVSEVAGAVGAPALGDQVGGAVENVTNEVLGDDGAVGVVLAAGGSTVAAVADEVQQTTASLTAPLGGAVNETVGTVADAVGDSGLGDQVGGAVENVTGQVLGDEGAVGQALGEDGAVGQALGGTEPDAPAPPSPGGDAAPPAPAPEPPAPVAPAVEAVEETAAAAAPVTEPVTESVTEPVTEPVTEAVTETVGDVGATVAQPEVTEPVGGAVEAVTDGVTGDDGVVGGLLGG